VIDGDTIGFYNGKPNARLVGFNAPETGDAPCEQERRLGERAKQRLRALVSEGGISLQYVQCSCPAGTQGTDACNYGRDCARLRSHGRDVGSILISDGLAESYVCGAASCPRRRSWC
jgi:endonuclease YncB( thermonuclease family)